MTATVQPTLTGARRKPATEPTREQELNRMGTDLRPVNTDPAVLTLGTDSDAPVVAGKPGAGHPRVTARCSGCGFRWPIGSNAAHCAGCHSHFAGPTLFDMHRVNFECVEPATLTVKKSGNPVLALDGGTWRRWADPNAEPKQWWK